MEYGCGLIPLGKPWEGGALIGCRPQMSDFSHIIIFADYFGVKCANHFWMIVFFPVLLSHPEVYLNF